MVRSLLVAALAASATTALSVGRREVTQEQYTIELAPGETKVVTEAEKWELKAVCIASCFGHCIVQDVPVN